MRLSYKQHTVDRSKSNTRFQDTQTQEATKAKAERDHGYSKSDLDTANLANKNTGQAQKQRDANSTQSEEGSKFNPGQGGEQGEWEINISGNVCGLALILSLHPDCFFKQSEEPLPVRSP